MKKIAFIITLLALCCGCSKDDPAQPPVIFGEWKITYSTHIRIIDGQIVYEKVSAEPAHDARWVFQRDGTGYLSVNFRTDKDNWQTTDRFKWLLLDNKLIYTDVEVYRYVETDWTVHELTSAQLVVSFTQFADESFNEQNHYIYTFRKVN